MKYRIALLSFLVFTGWGFGQESAEYNFIWRSASKAGKEFRKALMLIPVQLEQDSTTYYLQFDTGASRSYLYTNRIDEDTFRKKLKDSLLMQVSFEAIGSLGPTAEENPIIGTLGSDFLWNRIFKIDFEKKVVQLCNSYEATNYMLKPLELLDGRPVIEFGINGEKERLLYDTGSSLFGIWTTKRSWRRIRNRLEKPQVFPISSWGEMNNGYYSSISRNTDIEFLADLGSGAMEVWYVNNKKFKRFFRKSDLYGILGNQGFHGSQLILDYKNMLFGIWKED